MCYKPPLQVDIRLYVARVDEGWDVKIHVLGSVHVEDAAMRGSLPPLETRLIVVLALTSRDLRSRGEGEVRLGGLADSEIANAVWGATSNAAGVRRIVAEVNKLMPDLITRQGRYRYLSCDLNALDYNFFRSLTEEASRAIDQRDRFDLLDRAINHVAGPPLTGLDPLTPWLQSRRNEIAAEVSDVAAQWLESAILLNEKWTVIDRARRIQKWFPKDENICRYVTYLLYRTGNRNQALECYRETRSAHGGKLSKAITELAEIIEEYGDIVRATEVLGLTAASGTEPFRHRFTFAEAGEFFARMVGKSTGGCQVIKTTETNARPIEEDWLPDLIVGINRGGSIVGGLLAKFYNLCRVIPIIILWRTDEDGSRDFYVAIPPLRESDYPDDEAETVQRILVADEAFRSGNHIRLARKAIRQIFPHADIRVATLVAVGQDASHNEGPGRGLAGGPTYYGQLVMSRRFEMPWD